MADLNLFIGFVISVATFFRVGSATFVAPVVLAPVL